MFIYLHLYNHVSVDIFQMQHGWSVPVHGQQVDSTRGDTEDATWESKDWIFSA